mgnify:CR=1 FL=1|jgi:hypothetical protein
MECLVCFEEGVTQGLECNTCNRITCCSKCYDTMPRKFCPQCRTPTGYTYPPGDFSFMSDLYSREATEQTYKVAMKWGVFDTLGDEWEHTLFNATEAEGIGHSGLSWGFALHQIRKMRSTGSWADYVNWFMSAR